GGPGARDEPRADRLPSDPAEPRVPDRRHRDPPGGPGDRPRVVPVLPRARRAAADAGVGQYARRGTRVHAELVVDRRVPGARDLPDDARDQPDGQRATRLARPATEALA